MNSYLGEYYYENIQSFVVSNPIYLFNTFNIESHTNFFPQETGLNYTDWESVNISNWKPLFKSWRNVKWHPMQIKSK